MKPLQLPMMSLHVLQGVKGLKRLVLRFNRLDIFGAGWFTIARSVVALDRVMDQGYYQLGTCECKEIFAVSLIRGGTRKVSQYLPGNRLDVI